MNFLLLMSCLILEGVVIFAALTYTPSGYLGCFNDTTRVLEKLLSDSANNEGSTCKKRCQAQGYRYAGTEYRVECFCGNALNSPREAKGCNYICPGNQYEYCGGFSRLSLYDTLAALTDTPSGYLGCFNDDPRVLEKMLSESANNEGKTCKKRCQAEGYRYAGTEVGVQCFCGNALNRPQKASGCYDVCPGNQFEYCGGYFRLSLYDTLVDSNKWKSWSGNSIFYLVRNVTVDYALCVTFCEQLSKVSSVAVFGDFVEPWFEKNGLVDSSENCWVDKTARAPNDCHHTSGSRFMSKLRVLKASSCSLKYHCICQRRI